MNIQSKIFTISILILSLMFAGCMAKKADTDPNLVNLQLNQQAVFKYYLDEQYDADVSGIAASAREYIDSALASGKFSKPAIVFDIDDTLLDNNQYFLKKGYKFSLKEWMRRAKLGHIPPVKPMLEIYKSYVNDVDIIIITGRNTPVKSLTIRNLKFAGYDKWTNLILVQKSDEGLSAREYKTKIRTQLIEKDGYQIIANFGDQESDLGAPIQGKDFKLPNYLYFTK